MIVKLSETAQSESVRLRALRALLHDSFAAPKYSDLARRISRIEQALSARDDNACGQP
jgi:hypothetical protein